MISEVRKRISWKPGEGPLNGLKKFSASGKIPSIIRKKSYSRKRLKAAQFLDGYDLELDRQGHLEFRIGGFDASFSCGKLQKRAIDWPSLTMGFTV
jgi:hypothetical protein